MGYKPEGIGIFGGKFIPLHNGHVNAILRASSRCEELYVILSWSKDEPFSKELRLSWLGHSLREYKNIHIVDVEHEGKVYTDEEWIADSIKIKEKVGKQITKIFVGSNDHPGKFQLCYPEAEYIVLDMLRNDITISATQIRNNVEKNFDLLPKIVKKHFVKRVLITGTESVGKSTLTKLLRNRFNTTHVHEIGRDYCEYYNNNLLPEHFDEIAMKHWLAQDEAAYNSNRVMFVDSDAVVTLYYKMKYGYDGETKNNELITSIIKKQKYDLILYLEPSTIWVNDGFRFLGEQNIREENNCLLKNMYSCYSAGMQEKIIYIDEDGDYAKRFDKAVHLINMLLKGEL